MEKTVLDYVLVPAGLLIMVAYHLWLVYQTAKHPSRTIMGINAINRRFWVRAMMEDKSKIGVLAVQTLRNNIMASTLLSMTAIMLSSLIAVLMSNDISSSEKVVLGDRSDLALSVKYFSILVCFLLAFLFNVQSIRYYSHASFLVNVPLKKMTLHGTQNQFNSSCDPIVDYVARTVNRGSYFWSLGLRAFYFSFPLFLWIFGPIPMFVCCPLLVLLLYFLDVTLDYGWVTDVALDDEDVKADSDGIYI